MNWVSLIQMLIRPDCNKFLAWKAWDLVLRVCDLASGKVLKIVNPGFEGQITCCDMPPGKGLVVTGGTSSGRVF
jgi:hypothetical protein